MNKIQNCLNYVTTQSQVSLPLIFLNYCTITVLPYVSFPHTHTCLPKLQPQNPWLLHCLIFWSPHLEQSPPRRQALYYSLFLQKQTQDISLLQIFQLSNTVLYPYTSAQCVCVCVRVRVCVCVCMCVCVCVRAHLAHSLNPC